MPYSPLAWAGETQKFRRASDITNYYPPMPLQLAVGTKVSFVGAQSERYRPHVVDPLSRAEEKAGS
jgi:hypothetical protein